MSRALSLSKTPKSETESCVYSVDIRSKQDLSNSRTSYEASGASSADKILNSRLILDKLHKQESNMDWGIGEQSTQASLRWRCHMGMVTMTSQLASARPSTSIMAPSKRKTRRRSRVWSRSWSTKKKVKIRSHNRKSIRWWMWARKRLIWYSQPTIQSLSPLILKI